MNEQASEVTWATLIRDVGGITSLWRAGVLIVLIAIAVAVFWPQGENPQRWEYHSLDYGMELKSAGAKGWELVDIHPDGRYILKRPSAQ